MTLRKKDKKIVRSRVKKPAPHRGCSVIGGLVK